MAIVRLFIALPKASEQSGRLQPFDFVESVMGTVTRVLATNKREAWRKLAKAETDGDEDLARNTYDEVFADIWNVDNVIR